MGESILFNVTDVLPHFESSWINAIQQSLGYINATIELDKPQLTEIQQ